MTLPLTINHYFVENDADRLLVVSFKARTQEVSDDYEPKTGEEIRVKANGKKDDIVDNTDKKISFFIVNYNTTDYIHLLVSSIHKFVKSFKYDIWIFDNSDKEKLVLDKSWKDVHIIDNTKGQLINYDKEVYKYCNKEKSEVFVGFISVKHALAVQYGLNCPDISDDFILCDSDIVLKKDIDFINDKFACIGRIRYDGRNIPRLLPFLCYINKRTYRKYGLTYFDPTRFHGCILPDGSSRTGYDTGGCLFEDIVCKGLEYRTVDIFEYCVHFGSGSRNDGFMQKTNFNFKTIVNLLNMKKLSHSMLSRRQEERNTSFIHA